VPATLSQSPPYPRRVRADIATKTIIRHLVKIITVTYVINHNGKTSTCITQLHQITLWMGYFKLIKPGTSRNVANGCVRNKILNSETQLATHTNL
jgi:hypothetical protein